MVGEDAAHTLPDLLCSMDLVAARSIDLDFFFTHPSATMEMIGGASCCRGEHRWLSVADEEEDEQNLSLGLGRNNRDKHLSGILLIGFDQLFGFSPEVCLACRRVKKMEYHCMTLLHIDQFI
ncbi:hypothetical protein ACLOJK_013106 [Asimina triloba]